MEKGSPRGLVRHDVAVADEPDLALVARIRQLDDRAAFDRLVVRHQRWVHGLCARLLRSDDLAKDATQDVFTRALERLDTLRGDNFTGWLKAIAVNSCLNMIDRQKRWAPLDDAETRASAEPGPDRRLLQSERLAQARRLIARLPEKQRIVFCLKYIDGCSYEDIERLTGFSSNEVKSFLQNARRNFESGCRAEGTESAWHKTS